MTGVLKEQINSKKPVYMEWIHCNRCYELYIDKKYTFYLLAGCFHVICFRCAMKINPKEINGPIVFKCPLCLAAVRGCPLGNNMPPHLKQLFHPEPWLDGLDSVRIMKFQVKHRERIVDYIQRKKRMDDEIDNHIQKISTECKKLYHELRDAKARRKLLEKRVRLIKEEQVKRELEAQRNAIMNGNASIIATRTESGYHSVRPIRQRSTLTNKNGSATSTRTQSSYHSVKPTVRTTTTSRAHHYAMPFEVRSSRLNNGDQNSVISFNNISDSNSFKL